MGDLRDWLHDPNGGVSGGRSSSLPSSSPPAPPVLPTNLVVIGSEFMQKAEEETRGIIAQVQPTVVSEERRQAVIEYVQGLIKNAVGCEVFPFGSVPLKTYLPDGDIDLTAFGGVNIDEALANDVCLALEKAEQKKTSKFVVKDVQLIRAEVKLVKCLVQNIVVDISFNQFGGLCTLCFLEQVDRVIGKDHLFKRSIILIKAWCYYESRILGAHHGLISTYALETLVLYIFHLFHSSLNGPLAVLYKFLDYFSKFDWDNYCISLNGPVRISSLPELTAESPENGGHDLFLNDDFLKCCVEMFSAPWRGYETGSRTFPPKHLNIVDPLKENNNLGRSVSKGNFYRIKSAFTYGARKLGRILSQPEKSIGEEIQIFFSNTLDRHGKGQRPDVQDLQQMSGLDSFAAASFVSGTELQEIQSMYAKEYGHSSGSPEDWKMVYDKQLYTGVSNIEIPGTEIISDKIVNEPSKSLVSSLSKPDSSLQATAVSDNRLKGDAKDLATSRIQNLAISNDSPKSSMPHLSKAQHVPHLYFRNSLAENGEVNGDKHTKRAESDGSTGNTIGDQDENQLVSNQKVVSPGGSKHNLSSIALFSEDFYPSNSYYQLSSTMAGNPEPLNSLSDLSGDYECHVLSLNYGWMWYNYFLSSSIPSIPPSVISHLQSMKSWDVIRRTVQLRQNIIVQINANGVFPRPIYYPMNQTLLPGVAGFALEEMPKPRGTGTYFPNMNHYRDRPITPRGRNQAPLRSPRTNGRMMPFATENCFPERSNREQPPQVLTSFHKFNGRSGPSDNPSGSPGKKFNPNANGSMHFPHHFADLGSIGHVPPEPPLLRGSWQTNSGLPIGQTLSPSLPSPGTETLKPVLNMDKDRMAQSYRLKDEEDFPPLSI